MQKAAADDACTALLPPAIAPEGHQQVVHRTADRPSTTYRLISVQRGVVQDLVLLACVGIHPVLVHGGGPEINTWLNKLGIEAQFKNGLRVTDGEFLASYHLAQLLTACIDLNGSSIICYSYHDMAT